MDITQLDPRFKSWERLPALLNMMTETSMRPIHAGLREPPLFVDLDGTLIASDSLLECILFCAKQHPLDFLKLPIWLLRGRAHFKACLSAAADGLDVARLPYNEDLCRYLRREKATGRAIYLATAADGQLACRVADHLGLFDGVIASNASENLKGVRKLEAIQKIAGSEFVYAGNSRDDLVIWKEAASAIVVSAPRAVMEQAQRSAKVEKIFPRPAPILREMLEVMRPYQWLKNVLVFVPLLVSFRITDIGSVSSAIMAFIAFSLCASATYVMNDLLDVHSDRHHPRKRFRPFASGQLPILVGLGLILCGLGLGLSVAALESIHLLAVVSLYLAITVAYSYYLKTRVMLDVVILAALYAIRIVGGAASIGASMSVWLLAFALFVFLSLALVKRCAELIALKAAGLLKSHGRNYGVEDLTVLWPIGIATAVCSVLVLALYINSGDMPKHYATPSLLWLVTLGLFYWLGRMWIKTARGEMTDDPLVYSLRDFGSRTVIGGMVLMTLAAYFLELR
jgi:4-hydroxybenzoate polyprenyltransferase